MTMFIKILRILGVLITVCGILMSVLELFDVFGHAAGIMILILRNPILRTVAASTNLPQLVDYIVRKIKGPEVDL